MNYYYCYYYKAQLSCRSLYMCYVCIPTAQIIVTMTGIPGFEEDLHAQHTQLGWIMPAVAELICAPNWLVAMHSF